MNLIRCWLSSLALLLSLVCCISKRMLWKLKEPRGLPCIINLDVLIFSCPAYELTNEINDILNVPSYNRGAVNIWSIYICTENVRLDPKSAIDGEENYWWNSQISRRPEFLTSTSIDNLTYLWIMKHLLCTYDKPSDQNVYDTSPS